MGGGGQHINLAVLPCVNSAASVTLPCIVVANVVDDHILIWLGCQDVPRILIMQVIVPSIVQNGGISLLQADHTKSMTALLLKVTGIAFCHQTTSKSMVASVAGRSHRLSAALLQMIMGIAFCHQTTQSQ